jgi:hypothetical protein
LSAGDRNYPSLDGQQWPGYHQDREPERIRQEQQREQEIKARNLSARIQAADPVQGERIDLSTGRTYKDAAARGMYDDDRAIQGFRAMSAQNRSMRERFRWAQTRLQGRAGRN